MIIDTEQLKQRLEDQRNKIGWYTFIAWRLKLKINTLWKAEKIMMEQFPGRYKEVK